MPIFDFTCRSCGHTFEALVRGTTQPSCPQCKSGELDKHFSVPAVRSAGTKDLAMRAAQKRDAKQAAEATYTQRQYEANHDD